MKANLFLYSDNSFVPFERENDIEEFDPHLVLGFGARQILEDKEVYTKVREKFPTAQIALCSSAGEIFSTKVLDNSLTLAALQFKNTKIACHSINIKEYHNSFSAGNALISKFDQKELVYVLVLSDGALVNGSELVRGINETTKKKIVVTGGLAGDNADFSYTVTGLNSFPEQGVIIGIGFYGDKIKIGNGSRGGWEKFGLDKIVTKSEANVLYEIGHTNALELYKKYLGPEDAAKLPASALLFPLFVTLPGSDGQVVRTILSIDNAKGSMTFAGDIPQGSNVSFMKANFDKVITAASDAASDTLNAADKPDFALLISSVGRKLILQTRVEEEVEAIDEIFNHKTPLFGFYSYGELSPLNNGGACQLHNQTMTITTFTENE